MEKRQKYCTIGALRTRRFLITAVTAVIALAAVIYFSVFCRVKLVTVENNEKVTDTVILTTLDIRPYRHLYSIGTRKTEKEILALSPYVKSVSLKRNLPSELVIVLEEYNARYYIIEDDICYLLSDTLFVLEELPLSEIDTKTVAYLQIPEIDKTNDRFAVGKTIRFTDKEDGEYVNHMLKTVSESALGEAVTSLSLHEKANITAEIDGKYLIKLGNKKEMSEKLALCYESIQYLRKNVTGVKGTLHAWTTKNLTFEITGVAENP